jgi:hypothetical protein
MSARYVGHQDWQPRIDQHADIPAVSPDTGVSPEVFVSFPPPYDRPGGVRGDAFRVAGTYLDRSMQNAYEIITGWPEDDEADADGTSAPDALGSPRWVEVAPPSLLPLPPSAFD